MMLILLILNTHVIPLVNTYAVTERNGYANVTYWNGGTLVYAHNYLSGSEFYELNLGEDVLGIYADGSTQIFEVGSKEAYAINADEMRVGDEWVNIASVIEAYSSPESVTLFTCYPQEGQTTGRLFLEMFPVDEPHEEK